MAVHTKRLLRWDIYEEHLDEAAFRWSQWEKALDAPDYELAEVAALEEMMAAHLDGLVLGGGPVARRVLEPALATEEPERIVVATFALLSGEEPPGHAAVLAALPQAEPPALAALRRAFERVSPTLVPAELPSLLGKVDAIPELLALVLDVLGTHGLATAQLCAPFLSHPVPGVAAAALRTAGRARLPVDTAVLHRALESSEAEVRDAAIVTGLLAGHRDAWAACRTVAESRTPGARLPLLLLGMGGDERDVKRLMELLSDATLRSDALWALGFSGRVAAADACLEWMRHKPSSPLAGEAFSAITGLRIEGPYAAERQEPELEEPIPLEQEELDANLVPAPEDALPIPQADAVAAWWREARPRLDARQRHLSGNPFTPQALLEALASGPMRCRHALALELALRSRGAFQVPTRAFVERQMAVWKQAHSASASTFSRPFTEGLRS
jgi:uncharacterized protein (TIGR02270 family)